MFGLYVAKASMYFLTCLALASIISTLTTACVWFSAITASRTWTNANRWKKKEENWKLEDFELIVMLVVTLRGFLSTKMVLNACWTRSSSKRAMLPSLAICTTLNRRHKLFDRVTEIGNRLPDNKWVCKGCKNEGSVHWLSFCISWRQTCTC